MENRILVVLILNHLVIMHKKNINYLLCIMLCFVGATFTIHAQTKEIEIEGVLKMYVLDSEGNEKEVSQYCKTDWSNTYLAFVVNCNKKVNVTTYIADGGEDFIDSPFQSSFMIVPHFKYSEKDFAAKYANKRVRVNGTLYIPGAGWRNATTVVMNLKEIKLTSGFMPSNTSTSNRKAEAELLKQTNDTYYYRIPCNNTLFNSGETFDIHLPNGDIIQYRYAHDNRWTNFHSEGRNIHYNGNLHYIHFWLGNNGWRYISSYVIKARRYDKNEWWPADDPERLGQSCDIVCEWHGFSTENIPLIVSFKRKKR